MKRRPNMGNEQGRGPDANLYAAADRARLVRLWPLWVLIVVLLGCAVWRVYG